MRQLENLIEKAVVLCRSDVIDERQIEEDLAIMVGMMMGGAVYS